ncbi:MAG: hypothetical protein WDO68_03980 [Gammaproteobacteria bacterium]
MVDRTNDSYTSVTPSAGSGAMRGAESQTRIDSSNGGPNAAAVGTGDIGQLADVPDFTDLLGLLNGQQGADDPVAPPGAPVLSPPKLNLGPAEIAILIAVLFSKMDDAQSSAEQQGLKLDDLMKQESFRRTTEVIEKAAKKIQEALQKQHATGVLSTIGKVFAGIAAVALTLTTGGMAAPLAIALLTYTIVDTALTIADSISEASGGPHLALNDLLQEGFTKVAKLCGDDDKTAALVGQWCAFGVQAVIAVLTIAVSLVNVARALKGVANVAGGLASRLGASAFKLTRYTGIASQAISGVTQVTSGGLKIAVGYDENEAAKSRADKQLLDAAIAVLSDLMRSTLDRLELIAADLSAGMQAAAETVAKVGATNIEISGGNTARV